MLCCLFKQDVDDRFLVKRKEALTPKTFEGTALELKRGDIEDGNQPTPTIFYSNESNNANLKRTNGRTSQYKSYVANF